MEKNRCLEIDLMKIISCLAVITIHISALGIGNPAPEGAVRNTALFFNGLSNFAVPSFIFLSGLALMLRYGSEPLSFTGFIKKRMNSILIPYLGWSFTYFIIYTVAGFYALTLSNILSVIFLGTGEFHLYFVVILFQLYLLFPLLKDVVLKLHPLVITALAVLIHMIFAYGISPFPYMDRIFVPYLIYFIAGMLWGAHYGLMKAWMTKHRFLTAILYLGAFGLYLSSHFYPEALQSQWPQLWQLFSLASILLLMNLCTALAPRFEDNPSASGVTTLSAATFYVYLAHPLFIAAFYKLSHDLGFSHLPLVLPLIYVAVTAVSFIGALGYLQYKRKKRG